MDAMRRAAALTQGGDPLDATRVIREAMLAGPQPFGGPVPAGEIAEALDPAAMLTRSYTGPTGSRDYRLFLPPGSENGVRGVLLMLHGCTQGPEDFARGTAMNAVAAREGLIVVYPAQTSAHNPNGCWNWFDAASQHRDGGEPSILAGLVVEIARAYNIPAGSIFAAGLSAGGAMAAILGRSYPEIFSAIGVHSGLPAGAAQDVGTAFSVMNGNHPGNDFPLSPGISHARVMIVHGGRDRTVAAVNGARLFDGMQRLYPMARVQTIPEETEGFTHERLIRPDGTLAAEHWEIAALGHAWSGGDPSGSYTAPRQPDASEGFVRFFLNTMA